MISKYIIITAVRDEIENVYETLRSVIGQTILPQRWIIVDDGSRDGTRGVLRTYESEFSWISVFDFDQNAERAVGKRITEIIHEGLVHAADIDWEYWVKLDADIGLEPTHFESLLVNFDKHPRLGMASGKSYVPDGRGGYTLEWSPDHFVLGMARMYRRECWEDIGALAPRRLWDVIDVYTAQMYGWETRSFNNLHVIHKRPIDSLQTNQIQRRFDSGIHHYTMGYYPPYFMLRCLRAAGDEKPYLVSGLMMASGYAYAWLLRKQIYDANLKRFIQTQQKETMALENLRQYLSKRGRTLS